MTIEEAVEKIEEAKPAKAITLYGDDILTMLNMHTTDYDEADIRVAEYIVENCLADEILDTAGIILSNDDMIFESINWAVADAIVEVIGKEKYEELINRR